jgi:hypothetical protein
MMVKAKDCSSIVRCCEQFDNEHGTVKILREPRGVGAGADADADAGGNQGE